MMYSSARRDPLAGRAVVLSVALLLLATASSIAQKKKLEPPPPRPVVKAMANPPNPGVFQRGEELTYEVKYLAFKLGTITARCTGVDTVKGRMLYRMECLIRSYKGVPFVDLLTRFQSTVDEQLGSVSFSTKERVKDTLNKYIGYTFLKNRDAVAITDRIGNDIVRERLDTLWLEGKRWQDGLSLLFYARAHAHQHYTDYVPALIYHQKATTKINFGIASEGMDIDAVPYPVATWKIDGETGFTGIFGLTGGFEGWFSRDAAAVPIYAKMHVILGSVRLELISWKKPGWKPPRHG